MKAKFFLPAITIFFMTACNNNNTASKNGASPGVNDSTSANPASDAMDYHPDQRQQIPSPDSSNTIGTDTIKSGSVATPNTGTNKADNDKKGDSTKK